MDFFDLFSSKRRKQKKVDRFLLQMLAAQSGEYKEVLTSALGKIKRMSRAFLTDGKELMISYAEDAPRMDCKNDDSPFCSCKTNYGWVDFTVLDGKIAFVHYETPPHKINVKNWGIEEFVFYPELFNTARKAMIEEQAKDLPHDWKNFTADLPPLQEFFFNAYLKAYRVVLPENLQALFRSCNGASSKKCRIYGLHEWSHSPAEGRNFFVVGEFEFLYDTYFLLLDHKGKIYTCNDDGEPDDNALETPLPEFLRNF